MSNRIRVSMADFAASKMPDVIETLALGSCVSVVMYDASSKIGGITHAMLPSIKDAGTKNDVNPKKYVDTCTQLLFKKMIEIGATQKKIKAKIVGGANMFPEIHKDEMTIGDKNTEISRLTLKELDVDIIAEDVGGNFGRTVWLDLTTGSLHIRTATHGIKII